MGEEWLSRAEFELIPYIMESPDFYGCKLKSPLIDVCLELNAMMVSSPTPFFCQLAQNAGICSILNVALREEWMGTRKGEESFSQCLMRRMEHLKDLGLLRELGYYK